MRKDITLIGEPRPARGKNESRRLRVKGKIPAVLYGAGQESLAVAVDPKEIVKILQSSSGHNTIFNVQVNGETTAAMIVDWQFEPVQGHLLHIDLKRIDPAKRIKVSVPVTFSGEAKGVKTQGGLMEVVVREVDIECLPDDIPEAFHVDVTEMLIGQSRRASDLEMSGSMMLVSPPDKVLVHVVPQRGAVTEAAVEAAPAAVAEPEVAKKGKKEKEA